ncbi:hypothetical protein L596_006027 [Steinernema carpocapsae]|uniref:Uncharacterized protein n=1 Tax=Steinernema carpocapsae TaxID=34508 RepID=A0A4U8V614_STECR|nr:hypothetical protein L596_006027 [Steinernema carpocapsae]
MLLDEAEGHDGNNAVVEWIRSSSKIRHETFLIYAAYLLVRDSEPLLERPRSSCNVSRHSKVRMANT